MKTHKASLIALAAVVLTASPAVWAQFPNLADITGINVDLPNQKVTVGRPDPVGSAQRTVQAIGNIPGIPLRMAIQWSHDIAAQDAQPIPVNTYQSLRNLGIPDAVLQRTRYSTNWGATANGTLQQVLLANELAGAVTLIDIIVFRNPQDTSDLSLWAHELRHVEQYGRLGLDAFAAQYTVNAWVLENEAKDQEARVRQALPGGQPQNANQQFAYFVVSGQYLYGDANHNLYPADSASGRVLGPATGRVDYQNGQYWAIDSFGRAFPAVRVR